MLNEIQLRHSIRKYRDKPVEEDKLIKLIDSARLAPSGSNTQPGNFIIVKSESNKQKLCKVSHNQQWMLSAPVFIVCVADIRCRIPSNIDITINEDSPQEEVKQIIRDTTFAMGHILLEAQHLELSTCCVAWFSQDEIRPTLNIPSDKYVVGIITVGYADEIPKARQRKELKEILHYETW